MVRLRSIIFHSLVTRGCSSNGVLLVLAFSQPVDGAHRHLVLRGQLQAWNTTDRGYNEVIMTRGYNEVIMTRGYNEVIMTRGYNHRGL